MTQKVADVWMSGGGGAGEGRGGGGEGGWGGFQKFLSFIFNLSLRLEYKGCFDHLDFPEIVG